MELDGHAALERLIFQFSLSNATAAVLLGVSRRTVERWRASGRVPRRVALHVDTWFEGPQLRVSLHRTSLRWAARDNLVRDYLAPDWRGPDIWAEYRARRPAPAEPLPGE